MDYKKYKIVDASELETIDYNLLSDDSIETTRISLDGLKAVIEYKTEVEGGYSEADIVSFLEENYNDWNEDTTVIEQ